VPATLFSGEDLSSSRGLTVRQWLPGVDFMDLHFSRKVSGQNIYSRLKEKFHPKLTNLHVRATSKTLASNGT
jgi:hypothetical protein